ncbi:MAG: hypothetical protein ACLQNE_11615 [Thermoguttaceae bacterium]
MALRTFGIILTVAAALSASSLMPGGSNTAGADTPQGAGDLFYNNYAQPGPAGGVPAEMYPSPRPTPPEVGHTYMTYQPLYPQELLYQHHRVYRRCNPEGGMTTTRVGWWHVPTPVFHMTHRGGPLGPSLAGGY